MIFPLLFLVCSLRSVSCGGCVVVAPLNDDSPSIGEWCYL